MEKEKKKIAYDKLVLLICAVFFGIVSIIIWQLPVLKFYQKGMMVGAYLEDISGFQLAFGGTVYRHIIGPFEPTPLVLNACPLATATLILIILGVITSITSFALLLANRKNKLWKILVIASSVLYLVGGILCFFLDKSFAISYQNDDVSFYKDRMLNNYNVCPFYAIIAITCSFLTCLQVIYFKKEKTN